MTKASEADIETETTDKAPDSAIAGSKSGRKSIITLAVFALAINGTAALYTLPSFDFALPNVSGLVAELFPHEAASAPIPEPVIAALKDIQSVQQQHATALQDNETLLQQNAALLQHDAIALDGLRQSLTDEQSEVKKTTSEVKKISVQLSTLIAKVDSLQNAMAPDITSSIPKGRARARLSGLARKRMARSLKPIGPVSVGGAPLTTPPPRGWSSLQSPEG